MDAQPNSQRDDALPTDLDADRFFNAIRRQRATKDGRACIELARQVFRGRTFEASKEARNWVALGIACDKAQADGDLKEALDEHRRRMAGDKVAEAAAHAVAGNVVGIKRGRRAAPR